MTLQRTVQVELALFLRNILSGRTTQLVSIAVYMRQRGSWAHELVRHLVFLFVLGRAGGVVVVVNTLFVHLLHHHRQFWVQLDDLVVLLRFVEERVVLQLSDCHALVGVLGERDPKDVFDLLVFDHADDLVLAAQVDQLAQVHERVRHRDVRRYHLQQHETKTIDVIFTRFLLVFEQDALMNFRLLGVVQRDLSNAQVADLDVSVI